MPVQEEIYRRWIALRHRLQTGHDGVTALCYDICRQRTTSFMTLLAITPEKDTHAQNRERVPLTAWLAVALSTTRGQFTIPAALLSAHSDRRLFGHFVKCISTRLLCDRLTAPGALIGIGAYSVIL